MKSKAQFQSHPLHPILVSFPIAFFVAALACDLLALGTSDPLPGMFVPWLIIAGIGMGLLAAVPGFIDYLYTVPPKSSGSKRAARHGLINVGVLLVFSIALWIKTQTDLPVWAGLGLELLGVSLLVISGYMGGTLVYRNEIGVDRRYAGAGKWKEFYAEVKDGKIEIDVNPHLQTDQMMLVHVKNGERLVLARTEEGYVAFEDYCPHRGGSLAGGSMICGTVQCPWHGSQFDVTNGKLKAGPARKPIKTYRVEEEKGQVFIIV